MSHPASPAGRLQFLTYHRNYTIARFSSIVANGKDPRVTPHFIAVLSRLIQIPVPKFFEEVGNLIRTRSMETGLGRVQLRDEVINELQFILDRDNPQPEVA